jgi:hypothetical protein
MCPVFLNALIFRYLHRKQSQGFKSGEIGGHGNPSSDITGYQFWKM